MSVPERMHGPVRESAPEIEQLMEYRALMIEIVRGQGRGIRYARFGERARTTPGTEYLLPGAMTEWSIPDKQYRTHIERERRFSASARGVGELAGRLLVLESDSVRVGTLYDTKRSLYRFSWAEGVGAYEAEVMPIHIISGAQVDAEVVYKDPFGIQEVLVADHERTMELGDGENLEYSRYINPWREHEYPWSQVTAAEFDGLLARTDDFGHAILAEPQRNVA